METLVGNPDSFKVILRTRSKDEKWLTTVKAMEVTGVGSIIQTTTQKGGMVSQAVTFAPNVKIITTDGVNELTIIAAPV